MDVLHGNDAQVLMMESDLFDRASSKSNYRAKWAINTCYVFYFPARVRLQYG